MGKLKTKQPAKDEPPRDREDRDRPKRAVSNTAIAKRAAAARKERARRMGGGLEGPKKSELPKATEAEAREHVGDLEDHCEADGKEGGGCFLTNGERANLKTLLSMRVMAAEGLFQDALTEARVIEALKPAEASLLKLAIDIFYVAGRIAAPALANALSTTTKTVFRPATLERIGGVYRGTEASYEAVTTRVLSEGTQKGIDSLLRVGNRQARSIMKSKVENLGDSKRLRIKFLGDVKSQVAGQAPEIWRSAVTNMNDAELCVFTAWWDAENHSFSRYEAELAALLSAHKEVEKLGKRFHHVRNVVGPHGQKRLAHCYLAMDTIGFLRDYSAEQRGTVSEQWYPTFDKWVDDRFVGAAEDRQLELDKKEKQKKLSWGSKEKPKANVADITWDAPWFYSNGKLAKNDPEISDWIKKSTPVYKPDVYYPKAKAKP